MGANTESIFPFQFLNNIQEDIEKFQTVKKYYFFTI